MSQKQQQYTLPKCELCLQQVDQNKNYAGVFGRMCHLCFNGQIQADSQCIHQIDEGIFLGSRVASANQNILKQHNISAICVCGSELALHQYAEIKPNIKVLKIVDTCHQDLTDHLSETVQWIAKQRKQGKNILIHCAGGVSRSASICIAYFMRQKGMSYQQAYLKVKRSRKCIRPNPGFVKQLIKFQQNLVKNNDLSSQK